MPFTSTGLPGFNLLLHHFQLIIEQFLAYHTTIWRTQASSLLDQGCFICSPVSQACSHLRNATKKTADLTNTTRQRSGPLWEQHDLDWTEINGFHEKTHAVKKNSENLVRYYNWIKIFPFLFNYTVLVDVDMLLSSSPGTCETDPA